MSTDGRIVGYVRVSTSNQVENGDGLEIQRRKITDYCNEKEMVLDEFYADEGVSGAIKDRPGLLSLLKDCESGRIKRVIIYKYDRLARELSISIWIQSIFKRYGVEVSATDDPEFISNDPVTIALRNFLFVFADMERSIIIGRLKDGRYNNAKNGKRGSGCIPFGYKKTADGLEVDPKEAIWVEKIFRLILKGWGYSKIADFLNKNNVHTKRNKKFSIESIKYILKNELYYGMTSFGTVKTKGAHEAIISKRLFRKAEKHRTLTPMTLH